MTDLINIDISVINTSPEIDIESTDEVVTVDTQVIYGPTGKDGLINGYNEVTIQGGNGIEVITNENIITLNNTQPVTDIAELNNMLPITSNRVFVIKSELESQIGELESQIGDISSILTEINGE
jgi:hypothetical protein